MQIGLGLRVTQRRLEVCRGGGSFRREFFDAIDQYSCEMCMKPTAHRCITHHGESTKQRGTRDMRRRHEGRPTSAQYRPAPMVTYTARRVPTARIGFDEPERGVSACDQWCSRERRGESAGGADAVAPCSR